MSTRLRAVSWWSRWLFPLRSLFPLVGGLGLTALLSLGAGCEEPEGEDGSPVVVVGMRTILEDQAVTIALLEHAEDPDGDVLSVTEVLVEPAATLMVKARGVAEFVPPRDYHGPVTFRYVVSDGRNRVKAEYHLEVRPVNDPPVAVGFSAFFRFSRQLMLNGSDVESPSLRFEIVEAPAHGTLTGEAPQYVYTAAPGFFGDDQFVYRVHDGELASEPVVVTLRGVIGTAPVVSSRVLSSSEDQPVEITLTANDRDGDPVTFAIPVEPAHGTLSGTPPDLTYTPNANYSGTDQFTFSASDGILPPATAVMSITVLAVPDRPIATPLQLTLLEDATVAAILQGSDPDGTSVSYEVDTPPQHGTLTGTGSQRTYRPAANYHGEDSFTYHTSDGSLSSEVAQVTISVSSVPDAPVAPSFSVAAVEDVMQIVTLGGSDGDGDALTHTVLTQPSNGQLGGSAPALTYTPNANFNGTDSFTYSVTAGGQTTMAATVTLQVASINDAPVAEDGAVATAEDTEVSITLQSSDVDGSAPSYSIVTAPSDGVLSSGSGAVRTYTPAANAHGARSFTFQVSDGRGGLDTAVVTIDISAVNDAPTVADEHLMAEAATAASIDLLANDVDVDDDELEVASITPPAHGTALLEGGTLTYTPEPGFLGVEELSYVVVDEHGAAATAHVHLGVETLPPGMPEQTLEIPGLDALASPQSPSISSDGRFVTFSTLTPLLAEDTNGSYDVYLYDRGLRRLTRASVATGGAQANGISSTGQISGNGRYVVFQSSASNLVAGDSGFIDVFRHDRITGETVRISVAGGGGQALGHSANPRISDDGNIVAFESTAFNIVPNDVNGSEDVFVCDVTAGTTTRVSVSTAGGEGDASSFRAAISGDGQVVAFTSAASNLIAGDSNGVADVFVHERGTGNTTRASVSSTGSQADRASTAASLSRDGRFVSFLSTSSNLVSPPLTGTLSYAYVRDRQGPTTFRAPESSAASAALSGDGRYAALHTNTAIWVRDRFAGVSSLVASGGTNRWVWPRISGDGRYIMYLDDVNDALVLKPNPL